MLSRALESWLTPAGISAIVGTVAVVLAFYYFRSNRSRDEAKTLPTIKGFGFGREPVAQWRLVVFSLYNQRANEAMRLVGVRISKPRSLRHALFQGHDREPLGGPSKQLDLDVPLPPRLNPSVSPSFDNLQGSEFFLRLPQSPDADLGRMVAVIFDVEDSRGKRFSILHSATIGNPV
jgi:hypothetical protein